MHLSGHRKKKVLRDGARAEAVVLEREDVDLTYGGFGAYRLVLEVHFPDGARAELREKVGADDIGRLHGLVGEVLPIRYDPEDRSVAFVDVPAIQALADGQTRRREQGAVERARRALDAEEPGRDG